MVELAVTSAREPVADVLAAGDFDWGCAGELAKCAEVGKRAARPVRPSSRPAMIGPMPMVWVSRLPSSVTVSWIRVPITASWRSRLRTSATSSQATCLRARSAARSARSLRGRHRQ